MKRSKIKMRADAVTARKSLEAEIKQLPESSLTMVSGGGGVAVIP